MKVKADDLEYNVKEKSLKARGDVTLSDEKIIIKASEVIFFIEKGILEAEGDILYKDDRVTLRADRAYLDTKGKLGFIENGIIFIPDDNVFIQGKRIERTSEDTFTVEGGTYTTCDCTGSPSWSITTKRFDLTIGQYATASNLFFKVKNIPIMYIPYGFFPAKTERETGFLTPRINYLERDGVITDIPFFIVINRSTDITISSLYYSRRGAGGKFDFRYVNSPLEKGEIYFSFLDEFLMEDGRRRWSGKFKHTSYTPLYTYKIDITQISDRNYYQDFEEVLENQGLTYTESRLSLTKYSAHSITTGEIDYYQDMSGTGSDISVYHRLPYIKYSIFPVKIPAFPGYFSLNTAITHFVEESRQFQYFRSFRTKSLYFSLSPDLSFPFRMKPYIEISPSATLNWQTVYVEGLEEEFSSFLYPELKLNILTDLQRDYNTPFLGLKKLNHLIEPGVLLIYQGHVNEIIDVIQYKSPEIQQASIYIKNFLNGGFFKNNKMQYRELIQFSVFQNFFLNEDPKKTNLYLDLSRSGDGLIANNLYLELQIKGLHPFYLKARSSYNEPLSRFSLYNLNLTYSSPWKMSFSVDHKYSNLPELENQEILTSITQGISNFNLIIIERYSFINKRIEEGIYEVLYTSACKCWDIRFTVIDKPGFSEDRFKLTFSLKGLGNF